jgi:hypothetical protein
VKACSKSLGDRLQDDNSVQEQGNRGTDATGQKEGSVYAVRDDKRDQPLLDARVVQRLVVGL